LVGPNALNKDCCSIKNGRYLWWKVYEIKQKNSHENGGDEKRERKKKCHIRKCNKRNRMRKNHLY
jgi:hypothetical protein